MGTSIWFEVLRNSSLNKYFQILWFNVNVHKDFSTFGKVNINNIWSNLKLYIKFFYLLRNFKPELVLVPISQSTSGFLKDSIFIRLARKKTRTLVMLHGSNLKNWLNDSSALINHYVAGSFKETNGAIVLGKNLKHIFFTWYPEEKIYVVPNGLSYNNIPPTGRNNTLLIVRYIGSLTKSKGIIDLIEAVRHLGESKNKFKLIINGIWRDPEVKKKCEMIIQENLLPVEYEGEVTGSWKNLAYSETDIFVFTPNKPEGHPMVIIEAMASGLPIIATDQGAITESVHNGVNGFIVKPDSPLEIAEKIRYLINNPEERMRMGRESRRFYEENLREEIMVDRLKDVINRVLIEK